MLSYACYLTTDKLPPYMQRVVAPGSFIHSQEGSSEDLKQHFTDMFCLPNNRQYHMLPSPRQSGQFIACTLQDFYVFQYHKCSSNVL